MLFVMLLNNKPGLSAEESRGIGPRRANWDYPAGVRVLAEYWLSNAHPGVIVIIEADRYDQIMALSAPWEDLFDITVVPATTAEDGLRMMGQLMQQGQP